LGQGSYWSWSTNNGPGRTYNHYQWCTWTNVDLKKYETINNKTYETGKVSYRLTVIGWGSKSTNEVVVRIYVDQARSPERSKVVPGTTTLGVRLSCDFVYGNTSCATQTRLLSERHPGRPQPRPGPGVLKTAVTLPAATSADPDRKTGLNLQLKFEATNPARSQIRLCAASSTGPRSAGTSSKPVPSPTGSPAARPAELDHWTTTVEPRETAPQGLGVSVGTCHQRQTARFDLLPRIKRINHVRLYRLASGEPDAYPRLTLALTLPIR
jgi:hypothetical protein